MNRSTSCLFHKNLSICCELAELSPRNQCPQFYVMLKCYFCDFCAKNTKSELDTNVSEGKENYAVIKMIKTRKNEDKTEIQFINWSS